VRRKFVSWTRLLPSWKKAWVSGKGGSCVDRFGGLTGVPGPARRTRLVRSPVTPKLVATSLVPGTAIGGGTRFRLVPTIRTVKAAAVCSGFEPSGSTNVWKRTVSFVDEGRATGEKDLPEDSALTLPSFRRRRRRGERPGSGLLSAFAGKAVYSGFCICRLQLDFLSEALARRKRSAA
jgi:hypothetical protein